MKIKIWLACFLLCLVRAAAGEVSVTTLAVRGEWATLRIGNLPAGTVEVAVRDERGGPVFSRGVESDRGAVLMPVPTVAVAGLGEREWAVEVISRDAGGEMLQKARASVSAGGSARAMAAPAGVALRPGPFLPQSEVVEVAPEEMERAPAAALAGFASVYFPESLAAKLGQERVMAVVAAGTQVLIGGEKQPLGGLSRLTWTRIEMDSGTAWLCTSVAPPPLRLLTADVPRLEPADDLTGVRRAIFVLGPAAVFWAVAARMLFRRAATILAATAAGMVAIGGGAILCLRATAVTAQPMAVWDAERAGPPFNAAGIDTRFELAGFASRFGGSVELEAPVVLPIAATAREYWGLAHVTIHWEGHSSKMRVELGPRQSVLVQKRSFRAGELITRFPETAEDRRRLLETYHLKGDSSWWVMRGYVFAGDAGYFDSGGVVFSAWARGHPEAMGSLAAWYAMSFRADSEYLIWVDSGVPHVVEFEGGAAARR